MEIASVPEAIEWQARHMEEAGSPNGARIIRSLLAVMETDTATGRRIANWQVSCHPATISSCGYYYCVSF